MKVYKKLDFQTPVSIPNFVLQSLFALQSVGTGLAPVRVGAIRVVLGASSPAPTVFKRYCPQESASTVSEDALGGACKRVRLQATVLREAIVLGWSASCARMKIRAWMYDQ